MIVAPRRAGRKGLPLNPVLIIAHHTSGMSRRAPSIATQQVFASTERRFVKIVAKNYLKNKRLGGIMKVSALRCKCFS
jgi:hypothetical protein